jgi:hypothetical protein
MSQEADSGPPIGLPFEPFQPVNKALRRPVTPDERSPGAHSPFILEQPFGKGPQLLHAGVLYLRDPSIKRVAVTLTDHLAEALDLVMRAGHHRIEAEETGQ